MERQKEEITVEDHSIAPPSGRKPVLSKKIDPKAAVRDIRAGMDHAGLMRKYNLSIKGLVMMFQKLMAKDELQESELSNRIPSETTPLHIRNQFTGEILFSAPAQTIKDLVEAAVKARVSLSEADLSGANLFELVAAGADFSEALLFRANLRASDLSGAFLFRAELAQSCLSEADISTADLSEANLTEADLSLANLRGAVMVRANLDKANLRQADLSNADLKDARFLDASFENATLEHADLSGAELVGANLTGALLRGVKLEGANVTLVRGITAP
jgi:uncharacterized protein YjbI with pentapeptide repeats